MNPACQACQDKHISHWKCVDRCRIKKVVSENVFFTIGIITITKHLCFSEEKDIKKLVKDGRTDGRTEGRGEGKTNRRRKEGRKGGRKEGRKVNDGRTVNGERNTERKEGERRWREFLFRKEGRKKE